MKNEKMMKRMMTSHKRHVAMWGWLSRNPTKGKSDWPEWESNGGSIRDVPSHCFACTVASRSGERDCTKCPVVVWAQAAERQEQDGEKPDAPCSDDDQLFDLWAFTPWCLTGQRAGYAAMIRDLEWKENES
jgi:hypothetical protein